VEGLGNFSGTGRREEIVAVLFLRTNCLARKTLNWRSGALGEPSGVISFGRRGSASFLDTRVDFPRSKLDMLDRLVIFDV
jgi:hypothetical protein